MSRVCRSRGGRTEAPACSCPLPSHRSLVIALPEPNGSSPSLTAWLHGLTASVLPGLLRQADPQHVIEYSLALVTVLNEVSVSALVDTVALSPPAVPSMPLPLARWCCRGFLAWPLTALLCPLPHQYEQVLDVATEAEREQQLRAQIRKNITETLVSLRVNTVDDIQQIAAALAQCTVGGPWTSSAGGRASKCRGFFQFCVLHPVA